MHLLPQISDPVIHNLLYIRADGEELRNERLAEFGPNYAGVLCHRPGYEVDMPKLQRDDGINACRACELGDGLLLSGRQEANDRRPALW